MAQYEEQIKWQMPHYYEARYGKFLRVMRSSQPVHISTLASTNVSVAGGTSANLCSTTMEADEEMFMTSYGFSHTSTLAEMWFIDGNSTILPQKIRVDALTQCQITTVDAPFYRVDASHTIAAVTDVAGTVCAWATFQKFPTFTHVETESY